MKYSILGFNQELVCDLKKEVQREDGSTKTLCLDVTDLLILKNIADFMNRSCVVKLMINDIVYFSITHKTIIEDLPILGIKKQALKDRIDKMAMLGIIEKEVLRNECGTWIGYRLTDVYERLRYYDAKNSEGVYKTTQGGCSELHEGGVVNYNPNNNTTINNNNKEIKELKEKSDALFEECWKAYRRKGSKKKSFEYWKKLTDKEQSSVLSHIKAYVDSREMQYQKDFERYLRDKVFNDVVIAKSGYVVYDPSKGSTDEYNPHTDLTLMWNDYYKCYMYTGFYNGYIPDGYNDEDRPNGASVTLNNARGVVTWNSLTKKWEKQ